MYKAATTANGSIQSVDQGHANPLSSLNIQLGHSRPQDGKHPQSVQNKTACHIAIEAVRNNNRHTVSPFIIPPFGRRPISPEHIMYNWDAWERLGLINVVYHHEQEKSKKPSSWKPLASIFTQLQHFLYLSLVLLIGVALPAILVIIAVLEMGTRIGLFVSTVLTVLVHRGVNSPTVCSNHFSGLPD